MTRYLKDVVLMFIGIALISPTTSAVVSSAANPGAKPLELLRITPHGKDVPPGRQIVFQFNRPVVPVGRMQRDAAEIPVSITPDLDCQWRWLNTSALVCQLGEKEALNPATRYDVEMEPGISTEDGAALAQSIKHSFITERPKVRHAWFKTWESPGTPVIRMTFNQPVSQLSVEERVFMIVSENQENRIALNVEKALSGHGFFGAI
jgi:hypothetical protein